MLLIAVHRRCLFTLRLVTIPIALLSFVHTLASVHHRLHAVSAQFFSVLALMLDIIIVIAITAAAAAADDDAVIVVVVFWQNITDMYAWQHTLSVHTTYQHVYACVYVVCLTIQTYLYRLVCLEFIFHSVCVCV